MSGWLLALLTLPVCLLALWLWHLRRQEPGIGAGGSSEDEAYAAAVIAAVKKEGGYMVEEGQGPEQPVITLELSQRTTFNLRKVNRTLARLPILPRLDRQASKGTVHFAEVEGRPLAQFQGDYGLLGTLSLLNHVAALLLDGGDNRGGVGFVFRTSASADPWFLTPEMP